MVNDILQYEADTSEFDRCPSCDVDVDIDDKCGGYCSNCDRGDE